MQQDASAALPGVHTKYITRMKRTTQSMHRLTYYNMYTTNAQSYTKTTHSHGIQLYIHTHTYRYTHDMLSTNIKKILIGKK